MLNEVLTVIVVGLMLMVSIWAVKNITGGIMHGVMIFISIYLAYFILVNVIYVKKVPPVRLPSLFREIDDEIDIRKEELGGYEYRKVREQ